MESFDVAAIVIAIRVARSAADRLLTEAEAHRTTALGARPQTRTYQDEYTQYLIKSDQGYKLHDAARALGALVKAADQVGPAAKLPDKKP